MVTLAITAVLLGQVALSSQGGAEKVVRHLNFVGGGVTCSASSTYGTCFIDAGAGVTGTAPIVVTAGNVSCTMASSGVNGCLNSIAGQSQTIAGYKTWTELAQFNDNYDIGSGLRAGVYSPNGVGAKSLAPATNALGLTLTGRRAWGDNDANTVVGSTNWRDAGYLFAVGYPNQCASTYAFGVSENGDIHYGNTVATNTCASNVASGTLLHRNGNSGAHALDREDGYYLTIAGALAASSGPSSFAVEPDGGRPACDGGTWTTLDSDGGCRWNYAGGHGDVNIASKYAMRAGFVAEIYNPINGDRTDHRAYWDYNGAYAQNHGLAFAQFPGQEFAVGTSLGTFYYGALKSSQMYDFSGKHWYFADGTDWIQIADTARLKSGGLTLSAGSATTTVASGSSCVCGKRTNASNGVTCTVTGSTMTATGTGTDEISFVCF